MNGQFIEGMFPVHETDVYLALFYWIPIWVRNVRDEVILQNNALSDILVLYKYLFTV